jgi:hypothetical protein
MWPYLLLFAIDYYCLPEYHIRSMVIYIIVYIIVYIYICTQLYYAYRSCTHTTMPQCLSTSTWLDLSEKAMESDIGWVCHELGPGTGYTTPPWFGKKVIFEIEEIWNCHLDPCKMWSSHIMAQNSEDVFRNVMKNQRHHRHHQSHFGSAAPCCTLNSNHPSGMTWSLAGSVAVAHQLQLVEPGYQLW